MVADKSISLSTKRKHIWQGGGFLLSAAVCYVADSRRTFDPLALNMLHKMFLVSSAVFQKRTATKKSPSKNKPKEEIASK